MIGTRVRSDVGYTDVARRTLIETLNDQPHSPKYHRLEAQFGVREKHSVMHEASNF